MTTSTIACPICGGAMKISVTTNKNGKHAIGVHCPQDGRHFRGFINHKPYVEEVLSWILDAASTPKLAAQSPVENLQNRSGDGSAGSATGGTEGGAVR